MTNIINELHLCMLQLIVIARQVLHLIIRWYQIRVEPSASSTESSTNDYMADNTEVTSEEQPCHN